MYNGGDRPLRPDSDPEWGPNWDEDQGAGEYPNSYYFYLPRICNHCTHPSCVEACPRKAIYKREEDGIVLIDQERCRGYRYCVEGCPYKKVYYNATQKTSEKCIFCYPRIEGEGPDGETFAPACAEDCPPQLRLVGFLDDEEGPIHKLVEEYEVALPLHPEYQTQPNVYYIPPFAPPQHSEDGETVDVDRIPESTSGTCSATASTRRWTPSNASANGPDKARTATDGAARGQNPARRYRPEVFDESEHRRTTSSSTPAVCRRSHRGVVSEFESAGGSPRSSR